MRSRKDTWLLGLYLVLGLCGCSKPGIQDPGIEIPLAWNSVKESSLDAPLVVDDCAQVEQNWWKHFADPTLDAIILEALKNNKTLAIAKTRIEEVRAARLSARSVLFPQVTVTADASRGNQGFYTENKIFYFEDAAIQANWEIDLFGKNQARLDAANALVQTEYMARQAVIVGLLAEVGRNYFDLRNYERQISITEQNLASQKKTFELTQEQLKGGLASNFDVQRAGAQVSTTESRLPQLKIAYEMTCNRLNVLLGSTPGENNELFKTEEVFHPLDLQIVVAAPATVLITRPDVRAAERRFAASISEYEAAKKEWFPTISLLGLFGVQEMTLFNTSPTWNIGVNLVQPLINFGKIEADIEATDARRLHAFFDYQEKILEALEDMENALTNYLYEIARNGLLSNAAEQNRQAMSLANEQYSNGYSDLLAVLIVQRNVLETESSKAESDAKLLKTLLIFTLLPAAVGNFKSEEMR